MPLLIWCRLAFWEETLFLALFPYWLLTACRYLLFSLFSPPGPTLTSPQASKDPLKSKSPILMSHGSTRCFVVFASENTGPAWRNYPQNFFVLNGGGGYHSSFSPHLSSHLTVLPFVWSHRQIFPSFYEWHLPESSLGNGWLKKTFEKMCLSKLSPLIKPWFQ